MKNKQGPQLIDIADAAQILGVSQDTLRKWDEEGKLKSVRLTENGKRRYKMEDIEKFIETGKGK